MTYWQYDEELTFDAFARAGVLHMMAGQLTLFGVTCVGSHKQPHVSHGGVLFLTATQALRFATQCNELAAQAEADGDDTDPCHYLPTAMSVEPSQLQMLLNAMNSEGFEEDE